MEISLCTFCTEKQLLEPVFWKPQTVLPRGTCWSWTTLGSVPFLGGVSSKVGAGGCFLGFPDGDERSVCMSFTKGGYVLVLWAQFSLKGFGRGSEWLKQPVPSSSCGRETPVGWGAVEVMRAHGMPPLPPGCPRPSRPPSCTRLLHSRQALISPYLPSPRLGFPPGQCAGVLPTPFPGPFSPWLRTGRSTLLYTEIFQGRFTKEEGCSPPLTMRRSPESSELWT